MAESILTRRTKVELEYILLADIIVDTATTTIDITGLDIGKDDELMLVCDINNTSVDGVLCYVYANANYTNTNYYSQRITANNTTTSANRDNHSAFMEVTNGSKVFSVSRIKLTNNGFFVSQSNMNRDYGVSGLQLIDRYLTSTFTLSSITSLRIATSSTNAIGVGSRFQLYKIGGAN